MRNDYSMEALMSRSRSNAEPSPRLMKVLLVEDSALLREAIMDILSSCTSLTFAGIAVTQNEAIDKLHQEQFDLALVDIELAQGNGFEVIRATQTDRQTKKTSGQKTSGQRLRESLDENQRGNPIHQGGIK